MVWASRWSVALRAFYRQILSLTYSFFLWNFRPRLVRALLVYIHTSPLRTWTVFPSPRSEGSGEGCTVSPQKLQAKAELKKKGSGPKISRNIWAMKKTLVGWGSIGDYTTQLYRDYNLSLQELLLMDKIPNNHLGWLFNPINNGIIIMIGGAGFCPSTVWGVS